MFQKIRPLFLIVLAINLFVSGQAQSNNRKKVVVTTFTILADIAQNVAGDKADVISITRPGAEIHNYQITPGDIEKTLKADLIIYNGLGLERWFDRFYIRLGNINKVIITEGIEPISIKEGPYNNKPNPHAWMSPKNAMIYVENIKKALIKLDPANEKTYSTNANSYKARLQSIDNLLRQQINKLPINQRYLVTCEGAFSYFVRDYGLKEAYLWAVNSDEQGTPRQIASTIDTVKANKVPAVFCESTVSNKSMLQVAKESGSKFGGGLYVDSLSGKDGQVPTFISLLEYDSKIIISALLRKE